MKLRVRGEERRPGPRKLMILPVDVEPGEEKSQSYPTLLKVLEKEKGLKHTTQAQVMKARHLYVTMNRSVKQTAKVVQVDHKIVERWIMAFGWEEERDRRLFEQFKKISGHRDYMSPHTDQRHDRLAGTLEGVMERMLQDHADEKIDLTAKDLSTMASTLKQTMEIRRTLRNKSGPVEKKELQVTHDLHSETIDKIATMLSDGGERLIESPVKRLKVQFAGHTGTDEEYEEFPDTEAESEGSELGQDHPQEQSG